MIESILNYLNQHPQYVLLAIFAVSLLESLAVIGILIPGVGLLLAISALASQTNISVFLMLVNGTLGAILGDSLSYAIGQLFKERIHNVWPFKNHPQWIHQGHVFFKKHGNISIFAGRFIGPIRPFIPLVAGIMNMPKRDFLIWNITSAILWAPLYLMPGYFAGELLSTDWITSWKGVTVLIVASVIAILVTYFINHKNKKAR